MNDKGAIDLLRAALDALLHATMFKDHPRESQTAIDALRFTTPRQDPITRYWHRDRMVLSDGRRWLYHEGEWFAVDDATASLIAVGKVEESTS